MGKEQILSTGQMSLRGGNLFIKLQEIISLLKMDNCNLEEVRKELKTPSSYLEENTDGMKNFKKCQKYLRPTL